jgi:hypothetical protein
LFHATSFAVLPGKVAKRRMSAAVTSHVTSTRGLDRVHVYFA